MDFEKRDQTPGNVQRQRRRKPEETLDGNDGLTQLQKVADGGSGVRKLTQLQALLDTGASSASVTVQAKGAGRGLPTGLKNGIEATSQLAMDDVRVHYDSPEPAQLQAAAFARGSEIHLGPGQEGHLPHEAWHVVQQKQGRVRPTMQVGGVGVNDDGVLEREADRIGGKVVQKSSAVVAQRQKTGGEEPTGSKQRVSKFHRSSRVAQNTVQRMIGPNLPVGTVVFGTYGKRGTIVRKITDDDGGWYEVQLDEGKVVKVNAEILFEKPPELRVRKRVLQEDQNADLYTQYRKDKLKSKENAKAEKSKAEGRLRGLWDPPPKNTLSSNEIDEKLMKKKQPVEFNLRDVDQKEDVEAHNQYADRQNAITAKALPIIQKDRFIRFRQEKKKRWKKQKGKALKSRERIFSELQEVVAINLRNSSSLLKDIYGYKELKHKDKVIESMTLELARFLALSTEKLKKVRKEIKALARTEWRNAPGPFRESIVDEWSKYYYRMQWMIGMYRKTAK